MNKRTLLVIGAAGDVGQGIAAASLASGHRVIAAGRNEEKLARLAARHADEDLAIVVGDIGSEAGATALWKKAAASVRRIDAVAVSVGSVGNVQALMDWSAPALLESISSNLLVHFIAAKTFIPRLPEDGIFIGIGGGTADFIIPKMIHMSMSQAALRMMYRGLAREYRGGAKIHELMIVSMVNGESTRNIAKPEWVTDLEVGRHICAILDDPERFPEPILQLKSRAQVGSPASEA
jgi:NAD(P)-dependent dehydrogenase (short-subunit alcohol dehydrogenase family)